MSEADFSRWLDANQRYLVAEIAAIRRRLARAGEGPEEPRATGGETPSATGGETPPLPDAPPALARLAEVFGLSAFERDVLLLCAAYELDAAIGPLCAQVSGGERPYPTFGLALAALPGGHWSALAPAAPLRYWRLIEVADDAGLTAARLRIDERVLHHLTGVNYLDARLTALIRPFGAATPCTPAQAELAAQIAAAWREDGGALGVQLLGDDPVGQHAVAAALADLVGASLYVLRGGDVPAAAYERESLARLWDREAALAFSILLLECGDEPAPAVASLADLLAGPLIVTGREPLATAVRPLARYEVCRPRWQPFSGNGRATASPQRPVADGLASALTQRIEPLATWADLVLPPEQIALLREIAGQVRQMARVYDAWGFAAKSNRGLGISALFAGQSGTGKTMAAEVLANELGLDLYRIDLSAVVSKYIGETEKNLRRVFDAAEQAGAILLFDEADALFGKRSEVKDSHDRYANIEVSYLLQRMESYAGLAILTTNFKAALDPAFLRRIRFVVNFPFPDAGQRAEIWRRIFPADTPRDGVDIGRLTRLSVAGGNIRNIAVNAAFLAADAGEPVGMAHLMRAARAEYAKIEKPLSEVEFASRP